MCWNNPNNITIFFHKLKLKIEKKIAAKTEILTPDLPIQVVEPNSLIRTLDQPDRLSVVICFLLALQSQPDDAGGNNGYDNSSCHPHDQNARIIKSN